MLIFINYLRLFYCFRRHRLVTLSQLVMKQCKERDIFKLDVCSLAVKSRITSKYSDKVVVITLTNTNQTSENPTNRI